MIQRIRVPGPNGDIIRDRYLGGGPFGETDVRSVRYSHEPSTINGTLVAYSVQTQMPRLGLTTERNRRFRGKA